MTKTFEYAFVDESKESEITFEYDESDDEYFVFETGEMPTMYLNKQACLVFAKLFAKLAIGDYKDGFHFEVYEDFDADRTRTMRVVLNTDPS